MAARRCGVGWDVEGDAMAASEATRVSSKTATADEFKRASRRTDESLRNDRAAGQMGGAWERGGPARGPVLPRGLLGLDPAPRRRRVKARRHGDPAQRQLPGRAVLGDRGEVDRAGLPLRG